MFLAPIFGSEGFYPYEIGKSLRFRASASAYLSRTFGAPSNASVFTWSGWVKRGTLAGTLRLFGASTNTFLTFDSSDRLNLTLNGASAATSTAVFRDPTAHLHVVYRQNGASQTIWANGTVVASGTTAAALFNTAVTHQLGAANTSNYFDGYLSEINFVDGQALTPSSFGEFIQGTWIPKKYTGLYGTNGFYLPFNDGSSLANLTLDRSGNGNNWTANNISLTAGATYDWMDDTPTNNFAVLNPVVGVNASPITLSAANLTTSLSPQASAVPGVYGSIAMSTGKWYWEVHHISGNGTYTGCGISNFINPANSRSSATYYTYIGNPFLRYNTGGGDTLSAYGTSFGPDNIIGIAFDADIGSLTFYKDGVSQGVAANSITSSSWFPVLVHDTNLYTDVFSINFGQRPFAYAPPAGFKALCTKNFPVPIITKPSEHFQTVLATGANIKSQMDALFSGNVFEWVKDRANFHNHQLLDVSRGLTAALQSNTTAAETIYTAPSGSSVGWVWKAGGAPVANNAGSIPSQVSANVQAGFSIVTYTGTGANATVGHGLRVAPKTVIVKSRSAASNWIIWHSAFAGTDFIQFDTSAKQTLANIWNSTVPTSSVLSVGTNAATNSSGGAQVAYCFAEVPGFSKISSYVGNGPADGTFVYCGFRPKFVLIKRTNEAGNWVLLDSSRAGYNVDNDPLYANLTNSEATTDLLDITATGFKLRSTNINVNASGGTYIFLAVAEVPLNYANAR